MKNSIIAEKSFQLALKGVQFYQQELLKNKDFVTERQFLRSVTSVGANIREAHNAQSKLDFISKLHIAQKECAETQYWLELMLAFKRISAVQFEYLNKECEEVFRILRSIILTTKRNLNLNS
ncbi:four helix bundle protein [Flavobacterium sp.]|jgi:four helix bundle protein|uniref:four helix bundle protein n=1 Tax=Flavobacterium sp. TaxID=239 RepID=UPI0022BFA12D|nr:four helix bundle protein [Flavobacterium sp.]MCZ8143797.1 four helix bundle protein [Flavobacterium sp.]MCZ8367444.1 four helix bundle protein [Flavobacterium sp.]